MRYMRLSMNQDFRNRLKKTDISLCPCLFLVIQHLHVLYSFYCLPLCYKRQIFLFCLVFCNLGVSNLFFCSAVFVDMTADTALSLEGRGYLEYAISQNKKREYLLQHRSVDTDSTFANHFEIKFRTRSENGLLLQIHEISNYTAVKVNIFNAYFAYTYALLALLR